MSIYDILLFFYREKYSNDIISWYFIFEIRNQLLGHINRISKSQNHCHNLTHSSLPVDKTGRKAKYSLKKGLIACITEYIIHTSCDLMHTFGSQSRKIDVAIRPTSKFAHKNSKAHDEDRSVIALASSTNCPLVTPYGDKAIDQQWLRW